MNCIGRTCDRSLTRLRVLRTFAHGQLEAEIEARLLDRLPLELTDQQFRRLVADVVARRDDGGDRWCGTCGPRQVVEAGNRHLLRDFDTAALAFEQGAQCKVVVAAKRSEERR